MGPRREPRADAAGEVGLRLSAPPLRPPGRLSHTLIHTSAACFHLPGPTSHTQPSQTDSLPKAEEARSLASWLGGRGVCYNEFWTCPEEQQGHVPPGKLKENVIDSKAALDS